MQAPFPEVEFLRILFRFKKRKEIRRRMSTSYIKRQIRKFQVGVKEMYEKAWSRAELLFGSLNLLFFFFFEAVVVVVVVAA